MVKVLINGIEREVESGLTVIQVLEMDGIQVPRFCYHERLKIAGNCRMCLVEIAPGPPKPQASCAINVSEGMSIKTDTEMVKKAREGAMEFLLANHPLDCPICDQAGECDLQDQAFIYGRSGSRVSEEKRAVSEKNMGPFIKTEMTRCIHCTRCVRFMEDIAGSSEIGSFGRGNEMEISSFLNQGIKSELSGNIIDLCPVGALTAKPYTASYRSWELTKTSTIDVFDGLGSAISVESKGDEVIRVLPRINDEINEEWISDKSRFAIDGLLFQRLDSAYIKNETGKLVPTSIFEALLCASNKIKSIDTTSEMAIITGDFTDTESIFALKSLALALDCSYTEGRQKQYDFDISKRENYIFNSRIVGIDEADVILIVCSNLKKEAPVLNARIRRNILERGLKVYLIGENIDLTYQYIHLGKEKSILNDILTKTNSFSEILASAKKPMLIAGLDAFLTDGLKVHQILLQISDKYLARENWNGFNILHQNSSLVSVFDAKFVSKIGINGILKKAKTEEIKVIYAIGADEIDASNLKNTFIIYQGSHGDKLAEIADIILPSTAYTEKQATFVNTEGRAQKTTKAVNAKGDALDDKTLVEKLASELGISVSFDTNQKQLPAPKTKTAIDTSRPIPGLFTLSEFNFYTSDYISRNSKTMAKASREFACQ